MNPGPSKLPPAVSNLQDLQTNCYIPKDKECFPLRAINASEAKELMSTIKDVNNRVWDSRNRAQADSILQPWLRCLKIGDDPKSFLADPHVQKTIQRIREFGIAIVDTEGASQSDITNRKIGMNPKAFCGAVDFVQIGSLDGLVIFIQTQYDARNLAKNCQHPDKKCKPYECSRKITKYGPHDHLEQWENFGSEIPKVFCEIFEDPDIIKIQSAIVTVGNSLGDAEKLERICGAKIHPFVENANVVALLHNDQKEKSGNSFISKIYGLKCDQKKLGAPIYKISRRGKFQSFSPKLIAYDMADVHVICLELLDFGLEIVKRESSAGYNANVVAYIREMLFTILNEPNRTIEGQSWGNSWPFENWKSFEKGEEEFLMDSNYPWRCGLNVNFTKMTGPVITRNARQVAMLMANDGLYTDLSLGCLSKDFAPPDEYIRNPVKIARLTWLDDTARAPAPFEIKIKGKPSRVDHLEARKRLSKCKGATEEERNRLLKVEGENSVLKKKKLVDYTNSEKVVFYGMCNYCGDSSHIAKNCTLKPEDRKCFYPLCLKPGHTVTVCKRLHHICGGCRRRGHHEDDHQHHSILSLELIFRAWSPAGRYTALPIISSDEGHWRVVTDNEHRFSVYNVSGKAGLKKKYGYAKPTTTPPNKPRRSRQELLDRERREARRDRGERNRSERSRSPRPSTSRGGSSSGRSRSPRPSTSRGASNVPDLRKFLEARKANPDAKNPDSSRFVENPLWRERNKSRSQKEK